MRTIDLSEVSDETLKEIKKFKINRTKSKCIINWFIIWFMGMLYSLALLPLFCLLLDSLFMTIFGASFSFLIMTFCCSWHCYSISKNKYSKPCYTERVYCGFYLTEVTIGENPPFYIQSSNRLELLDLIESSYSSTV